MNHNVCLLSSLHVISYFLTLLLCYTVTLLDLPNSEMICNDVFFSNWPRVWTSLAKSGRKIRKTVPFMVPRQVLCTIACLISTARFSCYLYVLVFFNYVIIILHYYVVKNKVMEMFNSHSDMWQSWQSVHSLLVDAEKPVSGQHLECTGHTQVCHFPRFGRGKWICPLELKFLRCNEWHITSLFRYVICFKWSCNNYTCCYHNRMSYLYRHEPQVIHIAVTIKQSARSCYSTVSFMHGVNLISGDLRGR